MKKLTCHCGGVEAEVNVPEKGFQKIMRCNCCLLYTSPSPRD